MITVVGKLHEAIIRELYYLKSHSLRGDSQRGFRKKGSCLSNLLSFYNDLSVHDVTKSLDIIYLESQTAFDKSQIINYFIN